MRLKVALLALGTAALTSGASASAQDPLAQFASAERGPRFFMAAERETVRLDVTRTPVLRRRVSLNARRKPLEDVLAEIGRQAGLSLSYSPDVVNLAAPVTLEARNLTVAAALTEVLIGLRVDVVLSATGQLSVVRQPAVGTITGRVIDSTSREPVPRVQISVAGLRLGRSTDDSGRYAIVGVPAGEQRVTARRVGYAPATQTVRVVDGESVTLDFVLVRAATALQAVVTTVTGESERYKIGNAIAMVDAESIVRTEPVTSFADVLAGRVAGVQVRYNAGLSGSSPSIRIRGQNSFTLPNDPLLYIDGVRVANSPGDEGPVFFSNTARGGWGAGRLGDINPDEIESIEVVKGPSAATLYGTDAANGVILVRTKRGAPGRASWRAYAERGRLDNPGDFEPSFRAFRSWGRTPAGATTRCLLTSSAAGLCTIDSVTSWNPFNHAETTPLGVGDRDQYGLQVSGGVQRLRYFVSGDYESETGPLRMPAAEQARISAERGGAALPDHQVRPNYMRRLSLRSNGTADLGALADVSVSTGLVTSSSRIPPITIFTSGAWNGGYRDASDGWIRGRPGELFAATGGEHLLHSISSATANWRPLSWLQSRATAGVDFSSNEWNGLQRRGEGPLTVDRNGRRVTQRTNTTVHSLDVGATANAAINQRISSRTSVGVQYHRNLQRITTVTGSGLPPGAETVSGAAVVTGAEQTLESIVAGSYIEQTTGLDERLFVTAALRADGGSTFGKNFRTALYPKGSVSWVVLDGVAGRWSLSSVRLRAAYGASGVQPAPTAALPLIGLTPAFVDGVATTGGQLSALGNPDLKPERTAELEAGADVELWNERVRVEATYYRRRSTDALVNVPLAASTGLTTRQENVGITQNHGVEALVSARAVATPSLTWDITLNSSFNTNRLVRLAPGVAVSPFQSSRNVPGYPLSGWWFRPILGYADANGDGILVASEVTVGDTLEYFGPSSPGTATSLSSTISVLEDRLRIGAQVEHRGGYKNVLFTNLTKCSLSLCRGINDPNAPLDEQAAAVALRTSSLGSTWGGFVEDGDFVRLRELSLTYSAPEALAARVRARSASVTLAGRNLGLWTRLPGGIDPEANTVPASRGMNTISLQPAAPVMRYLVVRLNLGF